MKRYYTILYWLSVFFTFSNGFLYMMSHHKMNLIAAIVCVLNIFYCNFMISYYETLEEKKDEDKESDER